MANFGDPTYLSLFSGCGGLDLGFARAGYRCVGAYDLNQHAVTSYNRNHRFQQALVADLRSWRNVDLARADLVLSGPPCQGFSTVGRRAANDPRNSFLVTTVEIATQVGARAVVLENVPGALAGAHKRHWTRATRQLVADGFTCQTVVVDAAEVGLAQRRKRYFLIAVRSPNLLPLFFEPLGTPQPLSSVLDIDSSVPNHRPHALSPSSTAGRIARRIGAGQKLCNVREGPAAVHTWDIPEVFGEVTGDERKVLETLLRLRRQERSRDWGDADPVSLNRLRQRIGVNVESNLASLRGKGYVRHVGGHLYDLTHTFNGKYRRSHPDKPTNCVLTKFCQPEYFLHPHQDRAFTVREAARLQGFPDDFVFQGPERCQAVQVGNSVPPPVAEFLATWLLPHLP